MSPKAVHQMDLETGTNGATCDFSQKGNNVTCLSRNKKLLLGVGVLSIVAISSLWLFNEQRRRRLTWKDEETRCGTLGLRFTIPSTKEAFGANALACGVLGCRWSAGVCKDEGCCLDPEEQIKKQFATITIKETTVETGETAVETRETALKALKDQKHTLIKDGFSFTYKPKARTLYVTGSVAKAEKFLMDKTELKQNDFVTTIIRDPKDRYDCEHPCGLTCCGTTFNEASDACFGLCPWEATDKKGNYKENCFLFDFACMGFGVSFGAIRGIWDLIDGCFYICSPEDREDWNSACQPWKGKSPTPCCESLCALNRRTRGTD